VREHISEFAALMNRAWGLGSAVAADAPRKRELLEELLEPDRVFAFIGVDFGIGALQIDGTEDSRCAMTGTRKEDHVQVVLFDQAVQVGVDERQTGARAPMPEKRLLMCSGLRGSLSRGLSCK
jgi:hypothetical protein